MEGISIFWTKILKPYFILNMYRTCAIITPFDFFFDSINPPKLKGGNPYEKYNIKFVQSGSNFAQFTKIKNKQIAKIWSL